MPTPKAPPSHIRDSFDPTFATSSRADYDRRGAELQDICIRDTSGNKQNSISSGRRYCVSYRAKFDVHATKVAFGFFLKSTTGLDLAGVGMSRAREMLIAVANAGDIFNVSFWFDCPLLPGTYFVTAGCSGVIGPEREYLHRVIDGYVFRVLSEGETIAGGYFDLKAVVEINRAENAVIES